MCQFAHPKCKGVCSPGSPFLEPCVHIRVSHLGAGIYTHTNVCAHTDSPCARVRPPAQHPLPCAHTLTHTHTRTHSFLVNAYPCLNIYTHTHTHVPACVLMGPLPTLYPPPPDLGIAPLMQNTRRVWGSPIHRALPQHSPALGEIKAHRGGRHRRVLCAQSVPSGHRQQ